MWKLEHAYRGCVKALDLKSYRALWDTNFVGWPSVSSHPVHKSHITGWITRETHQGLRLKSYKLKLAATQSFGDNLVVDHDWLTAVWTGKNGDTPPVTLRMMHPWMRVGKQWQIIDGMSAPEPRPRIREATGSTTLHTGVDRNSLVLIGRFGGADEVEGFLEGVDAAFELGIFGKGKELFEARAGLVSGGDEVTAGKEQFGLDGFGWQLGEALAGEVVEAEVSVAGEAVEAVEGEVLVELGQAEEAL